MAKRSSYTPWFRQNHIFSLAYGVISFPASILARLIPKDPNLHIFGSFFGKQIGFETRKAYEVSTSVSKYLITKDKKLALMGKQVGVLHAFSLKGLSIQLRASRAHYSHSISDFVAPCVVGAVLVSLGYGIPVKKVGFSDPKLKWTKNNFAKQTMLTFFPYLFNFYCMEVVSPYRFFDQHKLEMYGIAGPTVIRPLRNIKTLRENNITNTYLFAPTYRTHRNLGEILTCAGVGTEKLTRLLERLDAVLYVHPHYLQLSEAQVIELPKRVRFVLDLEVTQSLTSFAGVVSDYSSFFFYAAEAGVPVAFVANDIADYEDTEQELMPWFKAVLEERAVQDLGSAIESLIEEDPTTRDISDLWRANLD